MMINNRTIFKIFPTVLFFITIFLSFSCARPIVNCEDECLYNNERICNEKKLYNCIKDNNGCFVKIKIDDCYRCDNNECKNRCDYLTCQNGVCSENSDNAICTCNEQFHKNEENICESNNKTINCIDKIPENSKSLVGHEISTISWNSETKSWSKYVCLWECIKGFHKEDEKCISDSKKIKCNDLEKLPENSHQLEREIEYIWIDDNWIIKDSSDDGNCNWECNSSYTRSLDECLKDSWSSVSVGKSHICGIKTGILYCWGNNEYDKLGLGREWQTRDNCKLEDNKKVCSTPQKVSDLNIWRKVSVGETHSCAIRKNIVDDKIENRLYCWGNNDIGKGKLGIKLKANMRIPVQVVKEDGNSYYDNWDTVSASAFNSCGIIEGALYCWGNIKNSYNLPQINYIPMKIGVSRNWKKISTGYDYRCGIKEDGLICWGTNRYGELGTGDRVNNFNLTFIDSSDKWEDIETSHWHSCGIKESKLYCWGHNQYGQLGKGFYTAIESSLDANLSPNMVGTDNWKMVTVGRAHSCGIKSNNKLYCWGNNNHNQLGYLTSNDNEHCSFFEGKVSRCSSPQLVNDDEWSYVTSSLHSTCAINTDGKLYCWGDNENTNNELPTLIEVN